MTIEKLFALIRADVRRPWNLWTSIFLLGSFALLAIAKLCFYRPTLFRKEFADSVWFWSLFVLLGLFVGAVISLLRRGVPRIVPALFLILLICLGWLEMLTAIAVFPGALLVIASRLLGGR
jgi:hypothetical protein